MAICYVNGREYQISKKIILNRISPYTTEFTKKQRNLIADEVIFRMADLEINGCDCQEYNFIEERYTDACLDYIAEHDGRILDLLDELDDLEIWKYLK